MTSFSGHITCIRSGGQTGSDRGALDAALATGLPIRGWCPKGGWAEDLPDPPGLLAAYPELQETPSADPIQRTEWNVRDSEATLVIAPQGLSASPGTAATAKFAETHNKPCIIVENANEESLGRIVHWLGGLEGPIELNVAGPRESECPGTYRMSQQIIKALLSDGS